MSFLSFPECSLGSTILCLSFLKHHQKLDAGEEYTLAGSVIINFRPGFFFGLLSVSSDPESIVCELEDSIITHYQIYFIRKLGDNAPLRLVSISSDIGSSSRPRFSASCGENDRGIVFIDEL